MVSKIFVIGGTGAQGIPVIQALVKDKKYFCRVLSRDPNSVRAKSLVALGNVEIVEGTFADEDVLRKGVSSLVSFLIFPSIPQLLYYVYSRAAY